MMETLIYILGVILINSIAVYRYRRVAKNAPRYSSDEINAEKELIALAILSLAWPLGIAFMGTAAVIFGPIVAFILLIEKGAKAGL